MAKKKVDEKTLELTADLQRVRADFENYRKRVEVEKQQASEMGEMRAIYKLLPVIDTIERAIAHVPKELKDNQWAMGVMALEKQLEKQLSDMELIRIDSKKGTKFDPELHQAVQFDEEAEGKDEVIDEELQAGYTLRGTPIRHAMVRVTKK